MSEGNLVDQQHHHHRHHKQGKTLFNSSRDSELELLDTATTTTSSPEIRSRSQSVGSAHREALLFFEQHRLFETSTAADFGKEEGYDCELRSISSCSRNSSPAGAGAGAYHSNGRAISASSLDKSDGAGAGAVSVGSNDQQTHTVYGVHHFKSCKQDGSEAERSPSSSKPASSSSSGSSTHHRHQFIKRNQRDGAEEELLPQEHQHQQQQQEQSDDLNRQNSITTSQCWNFPRVKLRKLFTAKSLDDILGGPKGTSSAGSGGGRGVRGRKSLQVASAQEEVSGERSSSSPEFICRSTIFTKKVQLLRDNKLSLPRLQPRDDRSQLPLVKAVHDGSKSPGAHSSKSAIVISTTAPASSSKQRRGPTFIKASRQKSRSFSALTSALLSKVPGHSISSANSPCSSTTSSTAGIGLSFFTKRSHQERKNAPPVIPAKKSGHVVVPCAKSDNCLNRIVASGTCAKFEDYFSENSANVSKSATSTTTPVEPFVQQQHHQQDQFQYPGGTPSSSSGAAGQTSSTAVTVVTAQPRKWTAIKNKWDQKLQASGDRQKEIGASLASVSNNALIFRKTHHHQSRQRSNSLSPLDHPESIESLLEITSPSPTLQEVRFLDTPEIRYASPIAVRSSRGEYGNYNEDDEEDSESLTEGASIKLGTLGTSKDTLVPTRASSACSSDADSFCSECKVSDPEDTAEIEMTRHDGQSHASGGGTKRSRDHHHHHHRHSRHHGASTSGSKEKPKLVVANVTYLQRPMSPGLVLRENSPSSSGTIDSFGNLVGSSGATDLGSGGNLPLSSVIRNNNVFTSNLNNQQSKTQQAKLEFFKAFASPHPSGSHDTTTRDPFCANNSSIIVNVNEQRQGRAAGAGFSGAFSTSISPSSSGGASVDIIRSSGSNNVGVIGTNNAIVQGAEHCGGVGGNNQSFFTDSSAEHRYSHEQGATDRSGGNGGGEGQGGHTTTNYGSRSSGGQPSGHGQINLSSGPRPGDGGQTNFTRGLDPSVQLTQGGPLALAQESLNNNNLYVDVDFGELEDDTMGDLQSPQYVKKTAHMFNSRFSSEHGTNEHERNGRNPSYLNVSRSVSGYSCLSYNNNGTLTSETVSNKSSSGNGTSLLTAGAPRLKSDFALHSPFLRNKVPNTDDDSSDHSSNQSATSPPPSLPPINLSSTPHGRFSDNLFFPNGMNRGEDIMEDMPYIPSHGKSFVMQRIERLYGSDAVSNKGGLNRKSSSHVTTISITRESPNRGKERIIPIKLEGRDNHQNNLYNKEEHQVLMSDGNRTSTTGSTFSTGLVLPEIRGSISSEEGSRAGHLNGNGNHYRNGVSAIGSTNGKLTDLSEVRSNDGHVKLEHIIHANGNNHTDDKTGVDGQEYCTLMKKALSRESSADSDDTNGCSEASLDLGNVSETESRKSGATRKDSQDNSLYSNRGAMSPVKPKPKPKPKDMALLRTFSRSPGLKTGTENLDKTVISLNIFNKPNDIVDSPEGEDQQDADISSILTDIKNKICDTSSISGHQDKISPLDDTSSHKRTDKENSLVSPPASPGTATTAVVRDGNYFLNEMKKVTSEILKFSGNAATELDTLDPSDDRAGSIHAAIGKGNLLVKKKFKQFEELCHANLKGVVADEPETTNEDLAGFWDMVLIQVDQIYTLFSDLEKKESSEETPRTPVKSSTPRRMPASTSKSTSRPNVGATPKVNSAAAKARDEARRKMLAEKRRAMKSQIVQEAQDTTSVSDQAPESEVQIFAPDTPIFVNSTTTINPNQNYSFRS